MVPTLKHGLCFSIGLAAIASAAMYVLAYLLFTIHEEIGLSANAARAFAIWMFPIVFLGGLVYYLILKPRPGAR